MTGKLPRAVDQRTIDQFQQFPEMAKEIFAWIDSAMKDILATIDEKELQWVYVQSSGPGGQNVNKVATAVQLRFDVAHSASLPEEARNTPGASGWTADYSRWCVDHRSETIPHTREKQAGCARTTGRSAE